MAVEDGHPGGLWTQQVRETREVVHYNREWGDNDLKSALSQGNNILIFQGKWSHPTDVPATWV